MLLGSALYASAIVFAEFMVDAYASPRAFAASVCSYMLRSRSDGNFMSAISRERLVTCAPVF